MSAPIEIQTIAVITSIACAIPGVFLVLRQMSMISDSISHTILLGIVIGFFLSGDMNSPILIIGAGLMGVFTVYLSESLYKTNLVSEDTSIGLVFPLLFSIAVLLISKFASSVHLDVDSILLGELTFAPFNRMIFMGRDIGAKSIYTMGSVLFINLLLLILFFKELKLSTFDPALAAALGFSPVLIHYALMTMVSVTAVGSFEAVGSILVIALMTAPPITAFLLTDDLKIMLLLSALIGSISSILGYQSAVYFDVSIAGMIVTTNGVIFLLVFIFSKKCGLIYTLMKRRRQKWQFQMLSLAFHLRNHEGTEQEAIECNAATLEKHMDWERKKLDRVLHELYRNNLIHEKNGLYLLTEAGHRFVQKYDYIE